MQIGDLSNWSLIDPKWHFWSSNFLFGGVAYRQMLSAYVGILFVRFVSRKYKNAFRNNKSSGLFRPGIAWFPRGRNRTIITIVYIHHPSGSIFSMSQVPTSTRESVVIFNLFPVQSYPVRVTAIDSHQEMIKNSEQKCDVIVSVLEWRISMGDLQFICMNNTTFVFS